MAISLINESAARTGIMTLIKPRETKQRKWIQKLLFITFKIFVIFLKT